MKSAFPEDLAHPRPDANRRAFPEDAAVGRRHQEVLEVCHALVRLEPDPPPRELFIAGREQWDIIPIEPVHRPTNLDAEVVPSSRIDVAEVLHTIMPFPIDEILERDQIASRRRRSRTRNGRRLRSRNERSPRIDPRRPLCAEMEVVARQGRLAEKQASSCSGGLLQLVPFDSPRTIETCHNRFLRSGVFLRGPRRLLRVLGLGAGFSGRPLAVGSGEIGVPILLAQVDRRMGVGIAIRDPWRCRSRRRRSPIDGRRPWSGNVRGRGALVGGVLLRPRGFQRFKLDQERFSAVSPTINFSP